MDGYDYTFLKDSWVEMDLSRKLSYIARVQEKCNVWRTLYPSAYSKMETSTFYESVLYSNAVEHIVLEQDRIVELIAGTEPATETEMKFTGYCEALTMSRDGMQDKCLNPEMVCDLHYALMHRYCSEAGTLRRRSGPHVGYGMMSAVRHPADPVEIPQKLKELCDSCNEILCDDRVEPLVAIAYIMLDFMNLSPFRNGNGRMYRILLQRLLIYSGYDFIRYVSLDRKIYEDAIGHTNALYRSSMKSDSIEYTPFLISLIDELWKAAKDMDTMFPDPSLGRLSKGERVKHAVSSFDGWFTKSDVSSILPDIAPVTIQQELSDMVSNGQLMRDGSTKACRYVHS
ncbi:MAG: Fic family protein [Candidatus Methanomethylophilaceae archaeon]|nr:Fic family protein [Candidatus Methanomethylophilaceae archaeon]